MNTYLPHLIELRNRVIRVSCVVLLLFLSLFYIDEQLYTFLAKPLLKQLPLGSTLIATEISSTFMVPMKLALVLSLFIAIPYILYQTWCFIAPGLYPQEKQKIFPFLISSLFLFYLGVAFSFYVICPMALSFFAKCAPIGVTIMTDIQAYLDFVLTVLFAGGIAFQVPIVTMVCVHSGLVDRQKLEYFRPYIIVLAFILGMLLTPPDVISQILLALPMWGLFELGLFFTRKLKKESSLLPKHFS